MDNTTLITIIAVTAGLVQILNKLIEFIIDKLKNDKIVKISQQDLLNIKECLELVKSLHKDHSVRNNSGIPLWYFPQNLESKQDDIITILSRITYYQDSESKSIEKIVNVLEEMNNRLLKLSIRAD